MYKYFYSNRPSRIPCFVGSLLAYKSWYKVWISNTKYAAPVRVHLLMDVLLKNILPMVVFQLDILHYYMITSMDVLFKQSSLQSWQNGVKNMQLISMYLLLT